MSTNSNQSEVRPQAYSMASGTNDFAVDLSRNESQSPFAERADGSNFSLDDLNRYPDLTPLRKSMASYYSVPINRVVPTAGGDQAIECIIRLSQCRQNAKGRMLTHTPSFEMLEVYANNNGIELDAVEWFDDSFPLESFLNCIPDCDLCVLTSPNNPTGCVIPTNDMITLAKKSAENGSILLLDFAYIEFADKDVTSELLEYPNVFIVRTLSKAWGLAGLRVGCALAADEEAANALMAIRGPYPISQASIQIACEAIENQRTFVANNIELTQSNRDQLRGELEPFSDIVLPSQGNFLLAKMNGQECLTRMESRGIRVRKFSDRRNLEAFVRITVPSNSWELNELIDAIQPECQTAQNSTVDPFLQSKETPMIQQRTATLSRSTRETEITCSVDLDGSGKTRIRTGLGFLDHMVNAFGCHSKIDIELECKGDLEIDDHHTVEDCAIVLGQTIAQSLGDKNGITRFASAYAPLDESLVRSVVDLSGRPAAEVHLGFAREKIGAVATENLVHFFQTMAMELRCALHVDKIRSRNDHHLAEAAFKSFALAMKQAISIQDDRIPSTKGSF